MYLLVAKISENRFSQEEHSARCSKWRKAKFLTFHPGSDLTNLVQARHC